MAHLEEVIIHGTPFAGVRSSVMDKLAWQASYYKGYREPNHQVPAHSYATHFAPWSVEMVTGVTKQWYPSYPKGFEGPYYDCVCVMYVMHNYPKGFIS